MIEKNILLSKMKMKNKKGFTIIELLIVISILAIISTTAFISIGGQTNKAKLSSMLHTLKNINEKGKINILFEFNNGEISCGESSIINSPIEGIETAYKCSNKKGNSYTFLRWYDIEYNSQRIAEHSTLTHYYEEKELWNTHSFISVGNNNLGKIKLSEFINIKTKELKKGNIELIKLLLVNQIIGKSCKIVAYDMKKIIINRECDEEIDKNSIISIGNKINSNKSLYYSINEKVLKNKKIKDKQKIITRAEDTLLGGVTYDIIKYIIGLILLSLIPTIYIAIAETYKQKTK